MYIVEHKKNYFPRSPYKNGISEEYVDIKKQGRQMRFNRTGYWRAQRATGSGVAAITVTHQLRPKVMLRAYYLCGPPRLMAKLSYKCSIYSGIRSVVRFFIFINRGNNFGLNFVQSDTWSLSANEYNSWNKEIEINLLSSYIFTIVAHRIWNYFS